MKPDLLTQILGFLSTFARFVGQVIVDLIHYILPSVTALQTLAEPIGYLALLTLFVVLVSAARRIALVILVAGWLLIFIRLLLMAFRIA
jgi:predicted membrane protein